MMKALMVLLSAVLLANHVHANQIFFPEEEEAPIEPSQASNPRPAETQPPRRRISPRLPQLDVKKTPKCAKNQKGICDSTNTEDYPTELVRSALRRVNLSEMALALGDEIIANLSLGNRFGGSVHDDNTLVDETAVCAAAEEIVFPSRAKNERGEWLYVANMDNVQQGVRVETCLSAGKPCKIGGPGTICRQKYIYRKLLAMDGNRNLSADNFRMPSSCVCYIKNEFLLTSTRFLCGRNSTKTGDRGKRGSRSSRRGSRSRRQAADSGPQFTGGETEGLSGSPLDNSLPGGAPAQGTAQQSIETEETLNPSDTIGREKTRYAGEVIVESNPILIEKKAPKRRRN